MRPKNCWEVMKCGREPNGRNEKLGICPAAQPNEFNGINNGQFGGRFCWNIAGSFCKGAIQGSVAQKMHNCLECAFLNIVNEEEQKKFIFTWEEAKKKILL